jgi:hypothetical protein
MMVGTCAVRNRNFLKVLKRAPRVSSSLVMLKMTMSVPKTRLLALLFLNRDAHEIVTRVGGRDRTICSLTVHVLIL